MHVVNHSTWNKSSRGIYRYPYDIAVYPNNCTLQWNQVFVGLDVEMGIQDPLLGHIWTTLVEKESSWWMGGWMIHWVGWSWALRFIVIPLSAHHSTEDITAHWHGYRAVPGERMEVLYFSACKWSCLISEGSLEVKLPTYGQMQQQWREKSEKREQEERRSKCEKRQKSRETLCSANVLWRRRMESKAP